MKRSATRLDGPVATVTLNRPEKLNAYTAQMGAELADAIVRADEDDAIRAVILTGEGRGFCAGADISAGAGSFDTRPAARAPRTSAAAETPAPAARGGGFVERAVQRQEGDHRRVQRPGRRGRHHPRPAHRHQDRLERSARFGFVFARRGLAPEAASAWFLPQLVGLPQALRWCLSGRVFGAEEALKGGLVSEIVEPEDLLPRAREIALEIAETTAPVSIALTRQMLWRFASARPTRSAC